MELNSQLHSSCWQARQWYHTHLEEEKKATKQLSSDKARRVYQWKSKNYKRRYQHYIKVAISLIKKFVFFVRNSDKCTKLLETISEAHALKRKYEEQVDDMGIFEETLKLLKDKNGTF